MESFSTRCQHNDGSITEIKVGLTRAARIEIESLVPDAEEMITRCFWRFIGLKHQSNEIAGKSVYFELDSPGILEIFTDLRRLDFLEKSNGEGKI